VYTIVKLQPLLFQSGCGGYEFLSGGVAEAMYEWVVGDSGNTATLSPLDFALGFGKSLYMGPVKKLCVHLTIS
jgi:hypothetical protein